MQASSTFSQSELHLGGKTWAALTVAILVELVLARFLQPSIGFWIIFLGGTSAVTFLFWLLPFLGGKGKEGVHIGFLLGVAYATVVTVIRLVYIYSSLVFAV